MNIRKWVIMGRFYQYTLTCWRVSQFFHYDKILCGISRRIQDTEWRRQRKPRTPPSPATEPPQRGGSGSSWLFQWKLSFLRKKISVLIVWKFWYWQSCIKCKQRCFYIGSEQKRIQQTFSLYIMCYIHWSILKLCIQHTFVAHQKILYHFLWLINRLYI